MTNETNDMPDVIYATTIKSQIIVNEEIEVAHGLWCSHEGSTTVEYQRRSDLVPAAQNDSDLVKALEDTNSLLAAMYHEKRPWSEINDQIDQNNKALDGHKAKKDGAQ
ncbi:hypothetical protein [Dyadobacter beijingensis]|nr:hypothetical protein [Dyadobacter beijingensis]